jgi:hypothetical protein
MKPKQYDRLGLSQPTQRCLEGLLPPEIVGEVANPVLEAIRRFWWRAFDRVCNCITLIRLSILDRLFGPEPPILADLEREADHERLVRAFPAAAEAIEPAKYHAGLKSRRQVRISISIAPIRHILSGSVPFEKEAPREAPTSAVRRSAFAVTSPSSPFNSRL